jgi:putative flippase GtrA
MSVAATSSRFAIVGLVCALAHNAILIGLDRWHIHYAISCVVSYVVVVLVGYALHVRFTFSERASVASFWRYALSMAANYPLMLALLFVMCDVAGLPVEIAAPAATVLMFGWNYVSSRWAIVRSSAVPAPSSPSRPS